MTDPGCLPQWFSPYISESGSLVELGPHPFNGPGWPGGSTRDLFFSASPGLWMQAAMHVFFYLGAGHLNSDPHVSMASFY